MSSIEHYKEPVGEREFDALMRQAKTVAGSGLVPSAIRGKAADVGLVLVTARTLGLNPWIGLSLLYPINGKICVAAQVMQGLALDAGHVMWIEETSDTVCTVAGHRRGQPERVQKLTWTIEMAKKAGLADKTVWRQFPAALLRARAISNWVRMCAPDALMGLSGAETLTPDEAGVEEFPDADVAGGDEGDDIVDAELVGDDPREQVAPGDAFDDEDGSDAAAAREAQDADAETPEPEPPLVDCTKWTLEEWKAYIADAEAKQGEVLREARRIAADTQGATVPNAIEDFVGHPLADTFRDVVDRGAAA